MATSNRKTVAFSEIEYVLIEEGLKLVQADANRTGDKFKATFAGTTLNHVNAVMRKFSQDVKA